MSDDYHNKGQEDASKGKYDRPHSRVEDLARDILGGQPEEDARDIKSYDEGWRHTKKQTGD